MAEWLKIEIENNPILELEIPEEEPDPPLSKKRAGTLSQQKDPIENFVGAQVSLYENTIHQAQCHFNDPADFKLAEWLIGHFNDCGFLSLSLEECAFLAPKEKLEEILAAIQTFDPPGIGARNIQESLLIQLKIKGKEQRAAYQIIEKHYEDLIHNRLPRISKSLHLPLEEICRIIAQDIIPLDLHPGYRFLIQIPARLRQIFLSLALKTP